MRLVEILAREMDEWPDTTVCYTQDKDGSCYPWTGTFIFDGLVGEWAASQEACIDQSPIADGFELDVASDHATAIVTREMWEAERARLNHGVEWGGEGLPPSGTDIEYLSYLGKWKKGRYLGEFGGRSVCGDYETGAVGYVEGIRPMCTAELIAAEERERVLDDIYRIIRNAGRPGNKADMAEALYDAGYRKQEKD